MPLIDDLRVDLGDDDGIIPSGQSPSGIVPVFFTDSLLGDLRVDIGDDDGIIPSGTFVSGIQVHSLLSAAHGDTTPASPSAGDLIVGGGTWSVLPSGDEGQVLSILGGQVTWAVDAGASGLAAHAADPDAHHTRYTDAEASGIAVQVATTGIANHAAISDAHHTRYTDAEAIAASSGALDHHLRYTDAEASGIAVQVTTSGIANHTAISDAHHSRYTDAEAISASSGALDHHLRYTDAEASGVAVQVVISGIANHTAISDAHHARYTDAEASGVASGLITIHAADSGAHHDRYTDEEAAAVAAQVLATGVLDVAIIQESGIELTADATTTSVLPVLSTLLSVPIDLVKPSGDLRILATAAVNSNGPVPVVFHIYIDGVFHRGTTVNVTGAIDNASIVIPRVSVVGSNPHTVDLRWAKFGSPFVTVNCLPVALPDYYHASLSVQEIL